jgi:(2S)-methylsuccinyl-CoA dehydrogenase
MDPARKQTLVKLSRQSAELTEILAASRLEVARAVKAEGADRHQIEVDHFVWCYAHAQAALALREWAETTSDPVAGLLAEIGHGRALSLMKLTDYAAPGDLESQLAELVDHVNPLEDMGARDEHRLLRSAIREFASREIAPHARDIHRQDLDVPEHIISGAAKLGLFGLSVPAEYGGSQEAEDVISMLIVTEELSRASLAAGGSLITRPEILVRALRRGGTPEQKRHWLPAIAAGEKLVAVAVTEADYGSNVAGLQCRAIRISPDQWEINGSKLWCTFAGRSELLMVLCRTADSGHRGLSVFVVEKPPFAGHEFEYQQPDGGALRGRSIPTIGYRGMHTFDLSFDRFRVPATALIGGDDWLNRGFYLQMEGFSMGRIQTAGRAVGVMQAAVNDATAYAKARVVFDKPLFVNQLVRSRLGGMVFHLNASRQLSYRAARLLDAGGGQTEASLAKLYASRVAESVTREAMQIYGAIGYSEETDVARYFVDARVLTIFEGAEEVLSLRVVGKSLLEQRE